MKKKLLISLTLATALVLASYLPAAANFNLAPGGSVTPPPTDTSSPSGAAVIIANTGLVPFVSNLGPNDFSGRVQEWVFREPTGTLDFVYQVRQDTGTQSIDKLTVSSYAGFLTSVGINPAIFNSLPPTIAPFTAVRSANGVNIDFDFADSAFAPGLQSFALDIQTNALNFIPGNISTINSGVASVPGFAPAPIPPSALLMGSGLLGLAVMRLRRRA
jgi:hypothetical protein